MPLSMGWTTLGRRKQTHLNKSKRYVHILRTTVYFLRFGEEGFVSGALAPLFRDGELDRVPPVKFRR